MYKIVKKQELTTNIYLMEVEADRVAKTCEPGQFVIVRMDSESERIPLTICDYNREKGTVTIVFQTVGAGTKLMAQLSEGEYFHDFVGPLGCPSELVEQPLDEVKAKKILFVAGGVGAAAWRCCRCYRGKQDQRSSDPGEGDGSCRRKSVCNHR
jgi:ferredoxin--NADP+ reductase